MCLSTTATPVGQGQRYARGLQFAMAGLGASHGNPGAQAALAQLRQTFQANHGGQTARQMSQARRGVAPVAATTGPSPSFTGG
jgi:hypothetical protein